MGRPTVKKGSPETVTGRMTLQRSYLDSGGYDKNGTYFGQGLPLYWCAYDDDDHEVDFMLRAYNRTHAKAVVREVYPNAKFYT